MVHVRDNALAHTDLTVGTLPAGISCDAPVAPANVTCYVDHAVAGINYDIPIKFTASVLTPDTFWFEGTVVNGRADTFASNNFDSVSVTLNKVCVVCCACVVYASLIP